MALQHEKAQWGEKKEAGSFLIFFALLCVCLTMVTRVLPGITVLLDLIVL